MFASIEQFKNAYTYESEATSKLLDKLTDVSLTKPQAADVRSIGRVAWHIVTTLPEMGNQFGLQVPEPDHTSPVPSRAADVAEKYRKASGQILQQLSRWNDADLQKEDNMYGQSWKRGKSLWGLVMHEIHHRGQLTVLMRMAGLPVSGVYGPAKEEWSAYGMNPPEI